MILSTIRKNVKNEKGISLLEIMVSMVFFAMITMSANTMLVGIVHANQAMKNTTQATQIGNQLLDELRSATYASLDDANKTVDSKYFCDWNITEANSMKKINLTIEWPLQTKKHKVKLSTIVAE